MKAEQAEPARIVVLISGSGSNFQAIAEACQKKEIDGDIVGVISNRPGVMGLDRAAQFDIPSVVIDHTEFSSREEFDGKLIHEIDQFGPDLVVLAGFMRILTPDFVRRYKGRLINIHPSLLPKYPGLNTYQRAIHAGDEEHGTSVHFVTEQLDGGPVILQAKVPIFDEDNVESLTERVQNQEHRIYPMVAKWFVEDRLEMREGKAFLDGEQLHMHGYAPE